MPAEFHHIRLVSNIFFVPVASDIDFERGNSPPFPPHIRSLEAFRQAGSLLKRMPSVFDRFTSPYKWGRLDDQSDQPLQSPRGGGGIELQSPRINIANTLHTTHRTVFCNDPRSGYQFGYKVRSTSFIMTDSSKQPRVFGFSRTSAATCRTVIQHIDTSLQYRCTGVHPLYVTANS